MFYRAGFDDNSVLHFEASSQDEALNIVASHADWGDEFTLRARPINIDWDKCSESRWITLYPGNKGKNAKRIR